MQPAKSALDTRLRYSDRDITGRGTRSGDSEDSFPGNAIGGPSFVKAVKGPCPWTSIMPTGGVEPSAESLEKWFAAGVTCVGMGSALITDRIVSTAGWKELTATVSKSIEIIKRIRSSAS